MSVNDIGPSCRYDEAKPWLDRCQSLLTEAIEEAIYQIAEKVGCHGWVERDVFACPGISVDGRFVDDGGTTPIPRDLSNRALRKWFYDELDVDSIVAGYERLQAEESQNDDRKIDLADLDRTISELRKAILAFTRASEDV